MDKIKLVEAKKKAKRRYERINEARNDEYRKLKQAEYTKKSNRKRAGIPVELPTMKPWDYVKGRVQ